MTKHKMVTAEEKEKVYRIGIFIKNHKNDSIIWTREWFKIFKHSLDS